MGKTAKVKTAGRFGSRYGVGIRKRLIKVETAQKKKHRCPECGFPRVKRLAAGIYICKKCNARFAGGAYTPETMSGRIVKKMIAQKSFGAYAKDLAGVRETAVTEPKETAEVAEENKTKAFEIKSVKDKPKGTVAAKKEKAKPKPVKGKTEAKKPALKKKKTKPKEKKKKAVAKAKEGAKGKKVVKGKKVAKENKPGKAKAKAKKQGKG